MESIPSLRYVRGSWSLAKRISKDLVKFGKMSSNLSNFSGISPNVNAVVNRLTARGYKKINIDRRVSALGTFLKLYSCVRFKTEIKILKPVDFEKSLGGAFSDYISSFPELQGAFNNILSTPLASFDKLSPGLRRLFKNRKKAALSDALQIIDLTDHIRSIFICLNLFADEKDPIYAPVFLSDLRKRGDAAIAGRRQIVPVTTRLVHLGALYRETCADPSSLKIMLVTVFLHDIGKIISQSNHSEDGAKLVKEGPFCQILSKIFNPTELELQERLILDHSTLADVAIIKEFSPASIFRALFDKEDEVAERQKFLGLLFLFSIADMRAKGLLSRPRLERLVSVYHTLAGMIGSRGKVPDLMEEELVGWGKERWNCWTTREEDDEMVRQWNEDGAERVLAAFWEQNQSKFFRNLGSIERVTLIFDLTRKLENGILRARLLILVEYLASIYQVKRIHFNFNRHDKNVMELQLSKISSALSRDNLKEMVSRLYIEKDEKEESIIVNIPVKSNEKSL